ncbi:nucleotidyltransferase family protein [Pseudemcibacter aquimaris]|uniref:nucleotidyltransferase family protein n=1 Tax=Pseudemcibacter aquimaris TaxID=2857064 RepID=UPI0020116D04|nr:nucleotidyltransferase family protein [Pseudemcibacter aquimaris]MCC3860418.1 nucleotidyltransferase family protein [Pseudemcibacter aquimaris]WDU57744.1 nucleotidyltransferase family protein [Pseudemcibacter aquimaris]
MQDQQGKLQIIKWINEDPLRREALDVASRLSLPDWCLAAGFVRNLVWDKLHEYAEATPLNDIDLIYFDPDFKHSETEIEDQLKSVLGLPWSVKNQARMHIRNGDQPYKSTSDAMSYWVEVETAVGATVRNGECDIIAPFGIAALFQNTVTINTKRPKPDDFDSRLKSKGWLEIWPKLKVL